MDTKFTEGPWLKCSRGEALIGIKGKNVSVYNCGLSGSGKSPESVANANLIAAAPDMYAMVESLSHELNMAIDEINTMRDIHHTDNLTPTDHWDKESLHDAQVLLAKARGE